MARKINGRTERERKRNKNIPFFFLQSSCCRCFIVFIIKLFSDANTCGRLAGTYQGQLTPLAPLSFRLCAFDGVVNLWQIQERGTSANFLNSALIVHLSSRGDDQKILPGIPMENRLFSVYSADDGDSQVAVMDLNKAKERSRVNFLEDKPHVKGIINNIMFMPWEDTYFVTGGSDHAVILWTEKDGVNNWKPRHCTGTCILQL